MARFIEGQNRSWATLFPEFLDEYIAEDNPIRFVARFVKILDLTGMDFTHAIPETTGRPPYDPGDLVKLYICGYLNRLRSSRAPERECHRNIELKSRNGPLRPTAPEHRFEVDLHLDGPPTAVPARPPEEESEPVRLLPWIAVQSRQRKHRIVNSGDGRKHEARSEEAPPIRWRTTQARQTLLRTPRRTIEPP